MFGSQYIGDLSRVAQKAATELESVNADLQRREQERFSQKDYQPPEDITEKRLLITQTNVEKYRKIFRKNLMQALVSTKEYNRKSLFFLNLDRLISENIAEVLTDLVENGLPGTYEKFGEFAGTFSDFLEGVSMARQILGISEDASENVKAAFWRRFVWPSNDMYNETMDFRFQAWKDLAPYWYLIEFGNVGYRGAYPQFYRTDFIAKSVAEILLDVEAQVARSETSPEDVEYLDEMQQIELKYNQEILDMIADAQAKLISNPEDYPPGYMFGKYMNIQTQKEYAFVATKTKRLGRRKLR